jgi:hypothetical protein
MPCLKDRSQFIFPRWLKLAIKLCKLNSGNSQFEDFLLLGRLTKDMYSNPLVVLSQLLCKVCKYRIIPKDLVAQEILRNKTWPSLPLATSKIELLWKISWSSS